MRKIVLCALALMLLCLPFSTLAAEAVPVGDPPEFPLRIAAIENPEGQNDGLLYADYKEGVLVLYVDPSAIGQEMPLRFTFASEGGAPVPRPGWVGNIQPLREDRLLSAAANEESIESQATLNIRVNPNITRLSLRLECAEGFFVIENMPVVWFLMSAAPLSRVSIWPGSSVTIGVGQELTLDIRPEEATTDRRLTLAAASYDEFVYFTPSSPTIKGLSAGTQALLVRNSMGDSIALVEVTVGAAPVAYEAPAPIAPVAEYRVLTRRLNVYRNSDNTEPRIGALPVGTRVRATYAQGDWVLSDMGFWLEAKYLAPAA